MTSARAFIEDYYIDPIIYDLGYNPVNTITWAIILVLSLFLVLKLLSKLEVKIDEGFILAVSPYIIAGSILRVIEDANIFDAPIRYILITPLIYFFVFFVCISILTITKLVSTDFPKENPIRRRRIGIHLNNYKVSFGLIGAVWVVVNATILFLNEEIVHPYIPFLIFGISLAISAIIYAISALSPLEFLRDKLNISILTAHLMDASASYIAIDRFGYVAKHVIEKLLVGGMGSIWMYPLKLVVILPILYVSSQFPDEDKELKNLILLTILILGLAPAIRNTLRMMLGI
jgi:uncharacterized membrane protein